MQWMIRQSFARLLVPAGAAGLVALGGCEVTASTPAEEHLGSASAALTAAQCDYFGTDDKVTICHRTASSAHPYTILRISRQACIQAHTAHAGDYVAVGDPTCRGGGCLPAGAPCDPTLPCCDGSACQGGVCTPSCVPGAFGYETRPYTAGVAPQSSGEAIAAFNNAPAGAYGYGATTLATLSNMSNQVVFQGSDRNIGYHVEATFLVGPADAGTWQLRAGMDFGLGGALLVDGDVITFRPTDMWWNGSFTDPTQYLEGSVPLSAGVHRVDVYGFENCCDGPAQMEYWSPTSGTWSVFSTSTLEVCCAAE